MSWRSSQRCIDAAVLRSLQPRSSSWTRPSLRRLSKSEEHLAVTVVPGSVADRFAVIREPVGRLGGCGEGAVGDQGGELAVGPGDRVLRRAAQPEFQPIAVNAQPAEDEIEDRDAQGLPATGGIADDRAAELQEGHELRHGLAGSCRSQPRLATDPPRLRGARTLLERGAVQLGPGLRAQVTSTDTTYNIRLDPPHCTCT